MDSLFYLKELKSGIYKYVLNGIHNSEKLLWRKLMYLLNKLITLATLCRNIYEIEHRIKFA